MLHVTKCTFNVLDLEAVLGFFYELSKYQSLRTTQNHGRIQNPGKVPC